MLALIGPFQATAVLTGIAGADLAMRRKEQVGPFVPIVRAHHRLSMPSGHGRPGRSGTGLVLRPDALSKLVSTVPQGE